MMPTQHLIQASVFANQGQPNTKGCPFSLLLGLMTRKSIGYSQKLTETITSCKVPLGPTMDLLASSNKFEVVLKVVMPITV